MIGVAGFLCVSAVSPSSSKMSEGKPAILIPYFYATGALSGLAICVALFILVTILLTKAVVNQRIRGLMIIGLVCNILQQSMAIYVYGFDAILRLRNLILLTILTYMGVQMYLSIEIYRSEDKLILGCLLF
jgi:predicted ATP-dependent Lon-type protease